MSFPLILVLWLVFMGGFYGSARFGYKKWGNAGSTILVLAFMTIYFVVVWFAMGN